MAKKSITETGPKGSERYKKPRFIPNSESRTLRYRDPEY